MEVRQQSPLLLTYLQSLLISYEITSASSCYSRVVLGVIIAATISISHNILKSTWCITSLALKTPYSSQITSTVSFCASNVANSERVGDHAANNRPGSMLEGDASSRRQESS